MEQVFGSATDGSNLPSACCCAGLPVVLQRRSATSVPVPIFWSLAIKAYAGIGLPVDP